LDLESAARLSRDVPLSKALGRSPFSLGVQTDSAFDRSVAGSTTGKPPIVNYSLNNFSVGGFLQVPVPVSYLSARSKGHYAGKGLPRTYLVISPYQYSRQIVGNYLSFPYLNANGTPATGSLTVQAPKVTSFLQKLGGRGEWGGGKWWYPDLGSYAEAGFQIGVFNDLLSGILDTDTNQSCPATAATTIADCLKKVPLPVIGQPANLVAQTETTHTSGYYWDIHVQKGIKKTFDKSGPGMTFTFDSKGDFFFKKSPVTALTTQTRYGVPLAFSLGFPILQNLTLGPTYSPFLYQNQGAFQSLVVNSFSISARWYFARDTAVPIPRQVKFKGPATSDQTKSTKTK
jgi:hypothetical protein